MDDEKIKIKKLLSLYEEGEFKKAVSLGILLKDMYPKNPVIFNLLGAIYIKLKKYNRALENYKKAIFIFPDYLDAINNLGNLYKDLRMFNESILYYDKALKINYNYPIVHLNKGNLYKENGQYKEAINCYLDAVKIDPFFTEAYNNLGSVYELTDDYTKAINNYKKAININSDFIQAYRNLSNLFLYLEKKPDAEKILLKILKKIPKDSSALHYLSAIRGSKDSNMQEVYSKELFDGFDVNFFESNYKDKLLYNAPNDLKNLLNNEQKNKSLRFQNVIDLGCGTGISGESFRGCSDYLVGIDISKNMIDVAKEKKIYDELIIGELSEVLEKETRSYDLVISTDVFTYLGDLSELFKKIKKISKKNSYFIFSTEDTDTEDDYNLNLSGRYSHSAKYIKELLSDNSFNLISYKVDNLRKESASWVKGGFYISRSFN